MSKPNAMNQLEKKAKIIKEFYEMGNQLLDSYNRREEDGHVPFIANIGHSSDTTIAFLTKTTKDLKEKYKSICNTIDEQRLRSVNK